MDDVVQETVRSFIKRQWPISVVLFKPLFRLDPASDKGGAAIYAIKNSIAVGQGSDGGFIFFEIDGSQIHGQVSCLADTTVGRELTYLESIADTIVAGYSDFYTAFSDGIFLYKLIH